MGRELRKEVIVGAPLSEVWRAWTTDAGAVTFFAPAAHIEAREGGAYELFFMLEAPEGSRGSEGCTVLGLEPERRLVVSWNFPPTLPTIRGEHTRVQVDMEPIDDDHTKVSVVQTGWREGDDWDQGFAYFDRAWALVLARLDHRFEAGPIDWNDPYTPAADEGR